MPGQSSPGRDVDDNLLQNADVRFQLLVSGRNSVELKNIGHDVDIGLVIQTACVSERHRAANLLESIRNRLALPTEFECPFGEVRGFSIGAVKISPVTSCAFRLKGTLSVLCMLSCKHAARSRLGAGLLSIRDGHHEEENQRATRDYSHFGYSVAALEI